MADWRDTRNAIEAARASLGQPSFDSLDNDARKPIWDFAQALLANYGPLNPKCAQCGAVHSWGGVYRCWDCKGVLCESCVRSHFGQQHQPHPATLNEVRALLESLEATLDPQTCDEKARADFDAPDDAEYHVTITAKQDRQISRLLSQIEKARRP